tara:strand:- start:2875 stop:4215 length:1341 start_codon:yes stop_codon:yes gene_type:complete
MSKLFQTVKISQTKVLSQQTRQAIKLLQLSTYELDKEIDDLILENPILEKNDDVETNYDAGSTSNSAVSDPEDILKYYKKNDSLREFLNRQIEISSLSDDERLVASIIIDCVNDNGYLTEDLNDIFIQANRITEVTFQEIFYVLHTLQRFEPIGTCALDLYDSLAIQLHYFYKDSDHYNEAMRIIETLSKIDSSRDLKYDQEISSICKNESFNVNAFELVKKLNPKPGLIISKKLDPYQILPEVVIYKRDDKWITELTSNKPPLKLNSEYVSIMRESKIKTDIDYLKKNYNEAKFIIKSIKNRNITILNVCKEIFKRQLDFLNNGDIGIKPMTLRDVSEALGVHESTVSRATSNKYVQTPRGVFEMKYFFTSELGTDTGQMVSSKAIMKMIKTFVDNEIKQKPLSDNQISELFKNKGISVARRTITKYREKLKIPSSNERKRTVND